MSSASAAEATRMSRSLRAPRSPGFLVRSTVQDLLVSSVCTSNVCVSRSRTRRAPTPTRPAAALATRTIIAFDWISSGQFRYGGRRLGGRALSRRAPSGARVRRAPRPIRRARRVSVPCRRDSDERRVQRAHRHAFRGHRTGTPAVPSLVRSFARADAASEWRECDRHNSYIIRCLSARTERRASCGRRHVLCINTFASRSRGAGSGQLAYNAADSKSLLPTGRTLRTRREARGRRDLARRRCALDR